MLADRAGRAGSSRAGRTAGQRREGDGPDLTPPGRCDTRRGDDATGSPNRNPSSVVRRQTQQQRRPEAAARARQRDGAAPSRREALSGGAAGGPLFTRPLTLILTATLVRWCWGTGQ